MMGVSKYNPHTTEWALVGEDWEVQYDAQNDIWIFAPPNAVSKYNPHTNRWALVGEDWEVQYAPHNSVWVFAPK